MARVAIPVTEITRAGVAPPAQTDADSSNNMEFTNDGDTFLEIVSSDAGSQTVEFLIATEVDDLSVTPRSVTVAAGDTVLVGPFTAVYDQTGTKLVYVNPSVSTTLKFRAYSLG